MHAMFCFLQKTSWPKDAWKPRALEVWNLFHLQWQHFLVIAETLVYIFLYRWILLVYLLGLIQLPIF
jgi:hypothetical protein